MLVGSDRGTTSLWLVEASWGQKSGLEPRLRLSRCSPRNPSSPTFSFPGTSPPQWGYYLLARLICWGAGPIAGTYAPQWEVIESLTTGDHMGAVISLPESPLEGCGTPPETQLIPCLLVAPSCPLPSSFFLPPLSSSCLLLLYCDCLAAPRFRQVANPCVGTRGLVSPPTPPPTILAPAPRDAGPRAGNNVGIRFGSQGRA